MKHHKIIPNLWFDQHAEEAVELYTSIFPNSKTVRTTYYGKEGYEIHGMPEGTILTIDFELDGCKFTALNGGPVFKVNPSITFFVVYETIAEVDELWEKLIKKGQELMHLDKYPWSDQFGWLIDQFGISWQIYLGKLKDVGQRVIPLFFFTGNQRGRAREAHDFYLDVFHNSSSDGVAIYQTGEEGPEGMVKHAQFRLENQTFMAMDSGVENDFPFNEAVSLIINCQDQAEVDYYWERLLEDEGSEQQCGWLKDKFGVSWQVIPNELHSLLNHPDQEKRERVFKNMMQMVKLDINKLKNS